MLRNRTRLLLVTGLALMLGACTEGTLTTARYLKSVSAETLALMDEKAMNKNAPILVRIYKADSKLEVWKQQRATGRFVLLRAYDICRWSGDLGPKVREGDRQTPEGFYTITPANMNPRSHYYLAFNTGFPNTYDRALNHTGSELMVHGDCSSRGCFAMTDKQIEEIFALARDAFDGGQRSFQLQIFPFRMTAENMYRYRHNPNIEFWRNLKDGSDHFEATGREPDVQVCGKHYVFDVKATKDDAHFTATEACPPTELLQPDLAPLVAERQRLDQRLTVEIAEKEREHRAPGPMLASVAPQLRNQPNHTPVPAHGVYITRDLIRQALPPSAPEALSLLPGAEDGPTPELKKIAKGEMVGTPLVAAGEPAAATQVAVGPRDAVPAGPQLASLTTASIPAPAAAPSATPGTPLVVAGVPVPQPSPLRPSPMVPVAPPQEPEQSNPLSHVLGSTLAIAPMPGWSGTPQSGNSALFAMMSAFNPAPAPAQAEPAPAATAIPPGVSIVPTPQPSPLRRLDSTVAAAPPAQNAAQAIPASEVASGNMVQRWLHGLTGQ